LFNGLVWRMGSAVCFDSPPGQQQAKNDAQDQLFLFGQAVHEGNIAAGGPGATGQYQWVSGNRKMLIMNRMIIG